MKFKTNLRLVSLIALLAGWLAVAPPAVFGQEAGQANTPRLDIVIIVDESGSMWLETDVDKERIDAFNLLIDMLAFDRSTGDDVRISVIAFGSAELSEIVLPFTPLNANTTEEIKQAYQDFNNRLANPPDGEIVGLRWTDALHALELAGEVFEARKGDHKPVMIILSDGKPETQEIHEGVDNFNPLIMDYIERIFDQAAEFQSEPGGLFDYEGICRPLRRGWVPIYTVAVREGAVLPEIYQNVWRELANQNGGAYYADERGLSLGQLGKTYYEIWTQMICRESELEEIDLEPGVPFTRQYTVSNLYKRIVFTVLKEDPSVEIKILRPGGTPVAEGEPTLNLNRSLRDEVWSIGYSAPWSGEWTVELSGQGTVWFAYEPFTDGIFEIKQLSPASNFISACDPVALELQITNRDGAPITANVQTFQLEVTAPDGGVETFTVEPEGDVFRHVYEKTCLEGKYKFSGLFQISDAGLLDEGLTIEWPWKSTMQTTLTPYLEIVSPLGTYYTDEAIQLQADIKVEDEFDQFTATQNPPVAVAIYQGANKVDEVVLTYDGAAGPARMTGQISPDTLAEGSYRAEFRLPLRENLAPKVEQSEFVVTASNVAAPPPSPTPSPTSTPPPAPEPEADEPVPAGLLAALICPLLLLLAAGGGLWWYSQRPALLPFTLTGPDHTEDAIRGKWGGKFPETRSFFTREHEPVQLQFSPARDEAGQRATRATLLNDLESGAIVKIDESMPLTGRGEWALITSQSHTLLIDNDRYSIFPLY